jgi:hypothetical protein
MKLALSLILALALVFTGGSSWVDTSDKIVAHAGGAQPQTLREAVECCTDDRIITAMALAFQPSPFHCSPLVNSLIHRSANETNPIRAPLSIYKLNAAFLI